MVHRFNLLNLLVILVVQAQIIKVTRQVFLFLSLLHLFDKVHLILQTGNFLKVLARQSIFDLKLLLNHPLIQGPSLALNTIQRL